MPPSGCTGGSCARSARMGSRSTTWAAHRRPHRRPAIRRTGCIASRPASGPTSCPAGARAGHCPRDTPGRTAWCDGSRTTYAAEQHALIRRHPFATTSRPPGCTRGPAALAPRARASGPQPGSARGGLAGARRLPCGSGSSAPSRGRHRLARASTGRHPGRRDRPGIQPGMGSVLRVQGLATRLSGDDGLHHPDVVRGSATPAAPRLGSARGARGALGARNPASVRRGTRWRDRAGDLTRRVQHGPGPVRLARGLRRDGLRDLRGGARRAACYLLATLDEDGVWRRGNSRFANSRATLYNARAAWALAEAGRRLGAPEFRAAAAKALRAVARHQHDDGWFPDCCLSDPQRPLLHTIAYTIRGLLEGGRVLEDERLVAAGARAAEQIALAVGPDGRLPGRFAAEWRGAASWSCLTGQVQMANIWLRLFDITNDRAWLEPVEPVLRFVKSTQNRTSPDLGVRGGIKGSSPLGGEYGPYQVLNWATKFFVDALLRDERRVAGITPGGSTAVLA